MTYLDSARCVLWGHLFKMDEAKRQRYCARCGIREVAHAVGVLRWSEPQRYTWVASIEHHISIRSPLTRPAPPSPENRVVKREGNVTHVRFPQEGEK